METNTSGSSVSAAIESDERVDGRRLWIAGLVAAVLSAVANEIVRLVADRLLDVPATFEPFSPGRPALFSVVGVAIGTGILAVLTHKAKRPIHTFRIVAVVLVALSMIPDIALLVAKPFEGVDAATVGVLALMHVIAAAITIPILTTWPRMASASDPAGAGPAVVA